MLFLAGEKSGNLRGSLNFHEGSVRSLVYHSQSVLYTLDSKGDMAVVLYSNGSFHVSRSITDGANRHSTNKLVLSPDGKFITTLCRSSRSKIQLYSPYLDQIGNCSFFPSKTHSFFSQNSNKERRQHYQLDLHCRDCAYCCARGLFVVPNFYLEE